MSWAHEGAGGERVQAALDALVELPPAEGQEVGALAALDVDHLDELARLDLVALGRGPVDPEVEPRIGQGRWQPGRGVGGSWRSGDIDPPGAATMQAAARWAV
jgi:hypothetical protein